MRMRVAWFLVPFLCLTATACNPGPDTPPPVVLDLSPPLAIRSGPVGVSEFRILFDEAVIPIPGTFSLEPGPRPVEATAEAETLSLRFADPLVPGREYRAAGEVRDERGNSTRFVYSFTGWNASPARLVITEVQTGKNSSKTAPHRDYVEFLAEAGDLGGVEVAWASGTKVLRYCFPQASVRSGEVVVLHLAPEGTAVEKDETGTNLSLSGGVDASGTGRDFWCDSGGIPDESGAISVAARPGDAPWDALFYASAARTGPVTQEKLATFLAGIGPVWPLSANAMWDDAYRWKPSGARSIERTDLRGKGPGSWKTGEAGAQSPGVVHVKPGAASPGARKPGR